MMNIISEIKDFPVDWPGVLGGLARAHGGRVAVTDRSGSVSFNDLLARAVALARQMQRAGLLPGEPVVTLIENSREAVFASFAIALCGACEVTLNPAQSADEHVWCSSVVGPRALLHDGRTEVLPPLHVPVIDCTALPADVPPLGQMPDQLVAASATDWGRILFTSGTTARPKGVVHTHRGRWIACDLLRKSIAPLPDGGSTLLVTPFSHGASLIAYALLLEGAPIHLLQGFDPAVLVPLIRDGDVRHVFAPPTVLNKLVDLFDGEKVTGLRTIFTGTAPMSAPLYAAASRIFGPCVRVTYGMSEIFNPITVLEPHACEQAYRQLGEGAVGLVGDAPASVQVSIRDEQGVAVAAGASGQIFVRAPHIYAGYLHGQGQFEAAPSEHPTGDIGEMHGDFGLRILGRMYDTIKTGGYKVLPQEIEAALRERGVDGELVILGLASEYWGEVITCARVAEDDRWIESVRLAAEPISRYKQPRLFVTLPELWKNAIGKVDRRRVREYIAAKFVLRDGSHPSLLPRARES